MNVCIVDPASFRSLALSARFRLTFALLLLGIPLLHGERHFVALRVHCLTDERTLWSGSRDTSVRAWDVQTGQCTSSAKVPRNLVTCLKYLSVGPSCSSSVVAQGGEDLRLRVWDAREQARKPPLTIEGFIFFPVRVGLIQHPLQRVSLRAEHSKVRSSLFATQTCIRFAENEPSGSSQKNVYASHTKPGLTKAPGGMSTRCSFRFPRQCRRTERLEQRDVRPCTGVPFRSTLSTSSGSLARQSFSSLVG